MTTYLELTYLEIINIMVKDWSQPVRNKYKLCLSSVTDILYFLVTLILPKFIL